MEKNYSYSQICTLLFLLVFITACSGQVEDSSETAAVPVCQQNPETAANIAMQLLPFPFGNKQSKIEAEEKIGEYVREIFEDKNGVLWFGTLSKGLARFDGKKLKYLTTEDGLADNQINGIVEDKAGNLWLATTNGVSKYDGKTFTNFLENEPKNNSVWSILEDKKGRIWVGTIGGVFRYDGDKFTPFSLPKAEEGVQIGLPRFSTDLAWSIIEDRKGNIWFGMDGVGVLKYDGANFARFTRADGLCNNNVINIFEDSKGNIWFGSREERVAEKDNPYSFVDSKDAGVSRYDGEKFKTFPEIKGLSSKDVGLIYEDKAGDIWIAAKHYGVYRYDGKRFVNFQENNGYTNNCIQSIREDKNRVLWFGFSGGLFRLNGTGFIHISKQSLEGC